ncbi:MAG: superoxide dismutase family protein, partial [Nitrospira sp.]|nr:superoxide dismutase family protein [Nitrospira sp.]
MNRLFLMILPVAVLTLLAGCSSYHTGKRDTKLQAYAAIAGQGIIGEADLYEEYEGRVRIKLRLEGNPASKLNPGRHAVHIHETGACDPF